MPTRSESDERDRFDHSDHPLDRRQPDDLRAPGGGQADRPGGSDHAADGVAAGKGSTHSRENSGRKNSRLRRLDSRNPSGR
jgi:hypothetical protein